MNKRFLALTAALAMAVCSAGCSDPDNSSSGSGSRSGSSISKPDPTRNIEEDTSGESSGEKSTGASSETPTEKKNNSSGKKMYSSEECFNNDLANAGDLESGPLLTISSTTAKPGSIAEVTLSVSNAEKKWSMCGLHIVYPDLLECIIADPATNEPDYTTGDAVKKAQGDVARVWNKNLNKDLEEYHMNSVFFTALCSDDAGRDGDLVTYKFRVPDSAQPGTVYNIDYYYSSNKKTRDMFSNKSGDLAFDKFAFTHATGGTITVE